MGSVKALFDAVGAAHAKEILFTARRYGAAEALQIGLVSRVVPVADLEKTVGEVTAMIADNAPLTVAASKLAVDAMVAAPGGDLTKAEAAAAAALASADYKEGRRAFMEKRRPAFTGR
jgi:enoyl-CoA hydratase/carnithine racemase